MKRIRKAGLAAGIGAILVTAAAFLALADTVKPTSAAAIAQFKKLGIAYEDSSSGRRDRKSVV